MDKTATTAESRGRGIPGPASWVWPALVAAGLLIPAYARTFAILARSWAHNPNYSHGFLIPPVCCALVFRLRRTLGEIPARGSWKGLCLVVPGAVLHVIGIRGDVAMFQAYSFILLLAGLVWTWFGWRVLRVLAFPLAFLLFMAPTFPVLVNQLSFRLKAVAAFGSVRLAQGLGVAVVRQGMDLFFPTGTLTIEGACSGLHSLIALMALGSLFAYLGEGPLWRRWVLFLLSVPVALAANIVRITSLCVYAAMTSTQQATGLFHTIGGFVLFGVALLALGACKKVLRC